jgi:hypothetical protein
MSWTGGKEVATTVPGEIAPVEEFTLTVSMALAAVSAA